jgi:hypothetical protein
MEATVCSPRRAFDRPNPSAWSHSTLQRSQPTNKVRPRPPVPLHKRHQDPAPRVLHRPFRGPGVRALRLGVTPRGAGKRSPHNSMATFPPSAPVAVVEARWPRARGRFDLCRLFKPTARFPISVVSPVSPEPPSPHLRSIHRLPQPVVAFVQPEKSPAQDKSDSIQTCTRFNSLDTAQSPIPIRLPPIPPPAPRFNPKPVPRQPPRPTNSKCRP